MTSKQKSKSEGKRQMLAVPLWGDRRDQWERIARVFGDQHGVGTSERALAAQLLDAMMISFEAMELSLPDLGVGLVLRRIEEVHGLRIVAFEARTGAITYGDQTLDAMVAAAERQEEADEGAEAAGAAPAGAPEARGPASPDTVRKWWESAWRAHWGTDVVVPDWGGSAWRTAAQLLDAEGSEGARRLVEAFVSGWDAAREASGGRLTGAPSIGLLWVMRRDLAAALEHDQQLANIVWRAPSRAAGSWPLHGGIPPHQTVKRRSKERCR